MATPEAQHALDVARRRRKGPGSPGFPLKNPPTTEETETPPASPKPAKVSSSNSLSVLDVLRILGGLVVLSSALSFFITGDSILWGFRPWYTRPDQLLRWVKGPVRLTDWELAGYDGTIEGRPIYLGLNGSIYDVTAGARMYGPGGSYSFFAGKDAARAYVTGCFQEDLTPDLRGVEEMFVPIDADADPLAAPSVEGEAGMTKAELKTRRERENRVARKKVHEAIDGWAQLFRGDKGKPYFKVGEIVREQGWLEKLPKRELCDQAKKARPKRKA